jgi:hypothetical protein
MLYPIIIPAGWSLVASNGERTPLPDAQGKAFHRVRAVGALLASEDPASHSQPEAMMLRGIADFGRMDDKRLDAFAQAFLEQEAQHSPRIAEKGLLTLAFSRDVAGKVAITRGELRDDRISIQYLIRDVEGLCWQLNYIVRLDKIDTWRMWLSEIERPTVAGADQPGSN